MDDGETPKQENAKTFEESFDRLVEVVEKLEAGQGSLTEMTALFEEGVALSKACSNELDSVERKVEILLGDGEEGIVPFETEGEE